jgi:hydrogenase-4 component B
VNPAWLLFATPAVPLLLAVVWPIRVLRPLAARLAPWGAVPGLLLALLYQAHPAPSIAVAWPGFSTGLHLVLDPVGAAFLLFTSALWVCAGAFSWHNQAEDGPERLRFFGFFSLTMAGNLGVVLAGDLLTFYLAFALMTFSAYGLVIHRRTPEALRAGRVYLVLALVGESALLMGLFALGAVTGGALGFGEEIARGWATLDPAGPGGLPVDAYLSSAPLVAVLLAVGFSVKAGLVPLHLWLPLAHPVAPTGASALLSGAMLKAGLLGWIRVLPVDMALAGPGGILVVMGVATAAYGVLVGVAQDDPKTVLAYSSVSQMGYTGIATGALLLSPGVAPLAVAAVVLYAMHHAFAKAALFLSVGVMGRVPGGRAERPWRRVVLVGAALSSLTLAGVPLTSGTVAKAGLKQALAELGDPWYSVLDPLLLLAAGGTTVLMGRFLVTLQAKGGSGDPAGGTPWGLLVPWGVLLLAGLLAPLWMLRIFPFPPGHPVPFPLEDPAAALGPVLVGLAIIALVLRRPGLLGRLRTLRLPAGDVLVLVQWGSAHLSRPRGKALDEVAASLRRVGAGARQALLQGLDTLAERDLQTMRGPVMALLLLGLGVLFVAVLGGG